MSKKIKLIRITTVPVSLNLLKGQMVFMQRNGFVITMISAEGSEVEELIKQEGCPHYIIPLTRKISPFKDLLALFKLYHYLINEKPDIVHSHTPKAGTVGMLAAKLAGVPIRLHTIAGLPLMESRGIKRFLLNSVEKITYSCATKIYPNSFGLKQIIHEHRFCPHDKLKVIGNGSSNGINTRFFHPDAISESEKERVRLRYEIQPEDFVFIFAGRLVKDKGINELVAAFKDVQTKYQQTKLLLVGSFEKDLDPLLPVTMQEIKKISAIIMVGIQNDIRPWLAISNCLVFPSYREGFPNVPMQAGAMGLPSIVTDINGCNEIVTHGLNGIIIPPKNKKALEGAMLQIIEDQFCTKKMAGNARESIIARFEQKELWKEIKKEYDMQLKKAGIQE